MYVVLILGQHDEQCWDGFVATMVACENQFLDRDVRKQCCQQLDRPVDAQVASRHIQVGDVKATGKGIHVLAEVVQSNLWQVAI